MVHIRNLSSVWKLEKFPRRSIHGSWEKGIFFNRRRGSGWISWQAGCFFLRLMSKGKQYINFLKTPEGRPRLSISAAAGTHETSRDEDHMKGETKSLEQDVRLSSRFRVRLCIRYSCLFPTAHLVFFPLT